MILTLLQGDVRAELAKLDANSVHCVVTSPPYWGLRQYLADDHPLKGMEIGGESLHDCGAWAQCLTPCEACYVCTLRVVFASVWRVLRTDGNLFLNLGDSSANIGKGGAWDAGRSRFSPKQTTPGHQYSRQANRRRIPGLKQKDLCMIPARVALALQADGWYLRGDYIWYKTNPMPESVTDRFTRAHEYIFHLTKRARYYFDADAVREPQTGNAHSRGSSWTPKPANTPAGVKQNPSFQAATRQTVIIPGGRNRRDVLAIAGEKFTGAHFATFPRALVEPFILAGSSPRCCEQCGAPWTRITKKSRFKDPKDGRNSCRGQGSQREGTGKSVREGREWLRIDTVETIGWRPSCTCADAAGSAACVVLDPFAGTGTVGAVALKHDRTFIGIELNPDYAAMAFQRLDPIGRQTKMWNAGETA